MSQIIFASHGDFAKGMLHSLHMIVGDLTKDIETFSLYPGENPNDYMEELKNRVKDREEQFIILCDILGGSVHTALSQLRQYPNVILLSGMNMGMAMDVILRYQKGIQPEEFATLVDNAKSGITLIHGELKDETDEDF